MFFLLKVVVFHCYACLPEGKASYVTSDYILGQDFPVIPPVFMYTSWGMWFFFEEPGLVVEIELQEPGNQWLMP